MHVCNILPEWMARYVHVRSSRLNRARVSKYYTVVAPEVAPLRRERERLVSDFFQTPKLCTAYYIARMYSSGTSNLREAGAREYSIIKINENRINLYAELSRLRLKRPPLGWTAVGKVVQAPG